MFAEAFTVIFCVAEILRIIILFSSASVYTRMRARAQERGIVGILTTWKKEEKYIREIIGNLREGIFIWVYSFDNAFHSIPRL